MKISVLSYNIHKGFSFFDLRFTLPRLRDFLREVSPDLVLLQEVVGENTLHKQTWSDWPSGSQTEYLAAGHWPFHFYGQNATSKTALHHRHHGNGILSRYPFLLTENESISNNRWEQRGLLHATVLLPDQKPLQIFNVHLDLTEWGRRRQVQKIVHRGESKIPRDDRLLLTGDFNDWRARATPLLRQKLGLKESFLEVHARHAKSFPSFWPALSLDRVYFRGLKVISARTLAGPTDFILSDHMPLLVEFETEDSHGSTK